MAGRESSPSAGDIKQRAHDILSREEFVRHESLVERVGNWIGDQLNRFSFGIGSGPGFVGNLVGLLVIAGIVVLLWLLVRAWLARARVEKPPTVDDMTIELEEGRSAVDWRADAERFEAAGEWREAMRARYRELVRALVDDRVLDDVPGRTTGEYRHAFVAARPQDAASFVELTDLFEEVWYGGRETDASDNARFRDLTSTVRAGALVGA